MPRSISVWCLAPGRRVLLLRRPAARAAGWQPVTGRVEAADGGADAPAGASNATDASLEAACVREIAEETGLPAPAELSDLGIEQQFTGFDGLRYEQRSFVARYPREIAPRLSDEHEEARWCSFDEATAMLQWDDDKAVLRALANADR